jgi:AcrR family transcriptional regulator
VEFARHGLEAANINRISVSAGLGKGTVYNYFSSKEELFLAVVEEACARAVGSAAADASAATSQRLRAAMESLVAWARADEAFARVLVRQVLSGDPRFHGRVLEAAAPFVSAVTAILADGVERGDIGTDVPVAQLALMFAGMGQLALVQHWGSGGAWPTLEEIPVLVVRLFLGGAAARSSRDGAARGVPQR